MFSLPFPPFLPLPLSTASSPAIAQLEGVGERKEKHESDVIHDSKMVTMATIRHIALSGGQALLSPSFQQRVSGRAGPRPRDCGQVGKRRSCLPPTPGHGVSFN